MMFIISPLQSNEEGVAATIERLRQAIANAGGEVTAVDHNAPWGRRKFAYPIYEYAGGEASRRGFTEGFYVLMHFSLASTKVIELERTIKLTDQILRHLITLVEKKAQAAKALAMPVGDEADADDDVGDGDGDDNDEA
jgi:small subunit ribosomal protein S6